MEAVRHRKFEFRFLESFRFGLMSCGFRRSWPSVLVMLTTSHVTTEFIGNFAPELVVINMVRSVQWIQQQLLFS
jgi:hypothetical protein